MSTHTLVLLRHAKAEPPTTSRTDAERPLSARGRADAGVAGLWIGAQGLLPDLVLCSPARRTRETWNGVVEGARRAGADCSAVPVAFEQKLYSAGVDALIELLTEVPEEISKLLVIGHNPMMSVVSAVLDPNGGNGSGLRTASLAVHTVADGWAGCGRGRTPLARSHTARAAWA